jgi:hypothetical protein
MHRLVYNIAAHLMASKEVMHMLKTFEGLWGPWQRMRRISFTGNSYLY